MPHDHSPALRAFVLIARHGSFTRASREIGVTASALSQTLAQFERQLGVRLLARTTRRVGLTEAGRAFLERIAPALGVIDDAVDSARQYGERPAGTLRITAAMGRSWRPTLRHSSRPIPRSRWRSTSTARFPIWSRRASMRASGWANAWRRT